MYLITNRSIFFRMNHYFAINNYKELCLVGGVPEAILYHVDVSFIDSDNNFDVDGLFFYGTVDDFKLVDKLLCNGPGNKFSYSSPLQYTYEQELHTLTQLRDDVENLSAALGLGAHLSLTQEQRREQNCKKHQERLWAACKEKAEPGQPKESTVNDPQNDLEEICNLFGNLTDSIKAFFGNQRMPGKGAIIQGGPMTDVQIANAVLDHDMINPFYSDTVREVNGQPVISFGLGTMGYDTRLRPIFKLFKKDPTNGAIDPKAFNERHVRVVEGDVIELPPKTYALSETVECFNMPNDVMAFCLAKSTYARCCIGVNTTPIWPGFKGHVVIEFYNHGDVPVKIYANEGFAQFVFMRASESVKRNYADRGGVYHGQETGVQSAKVGKQ